MSFSLEQSGNSAGHCAEEGCTYAPNFPDVDGTLYCHRHYPGDGSFQHMEDEARRQELREEWELHQ